MLSENAEAFLAWQNSLGPHPPKSSKGASDGP